MLSVPANVALFVILCWVSLTTGCSSSTRRTADIQSTTSSSTPPKPMTCPSDCYCKRECATVVEVAEAAAVLEKALVTELKHQLRLLKTSAQSTSFCNITRSKWEKESKKLNKKLEGSQGPTCRLRLPSDSAICAAFVKLSECAVSRLRIAYTNQEHCLTGENHAGWLVIMKKLRLSTRTLKHMYDSALTERKPRWEAIKSSIFDLNGNRGPLMRLFDLSKDRNSCKSDGLCLKSEPPSARDVGNVNSGYLTQQNVVDATWFMKSTDHE